MPKNSLIPSPGQTVYLRSQFFRVTAITPHSSIPKKSPQHLVSLSTIDHNPTTIQVIWELEVNPISNYTTTTPLPHNRHSPHYDPYPLLQAIILAHHCSDATKIHQRCLLSPLRHSLQNLPFQAVPAYRTLNNPRINLFLADHVGLGKSIEAALLISELLAKRRAQRILILCPANLQTQWQTLLAKHFSLPFDIINRKHIIQFHKAHGLTSNPWKHSSFAISSLDFLKQDNQTQLFLQSLKNKSQPMRPWDLLVVDEAHRITPKKYSSKNDSERVKLAKTLIPLFEHRLFISATPHNGSTQNFKALLQLLDPLKFSTRKEIDPQLLQTTLIRRPKSLIQSLYPNLKLPKRIVKFIPFQLSSEERKLQHSLSQYIHTALQISQQKSMRLIAIILKKRLLSSNLAFAKSFRKHIQFNQQSIHPKTNQNQQLFNPEWLLLEQNDLENTLFSKCSHLFQNPKLQALAEDILNQLENPNLKDSKTQALLNHIGKSKDKVIVFSEYIDTLTHLQSALPIPTLSLNSQQSRSEQSAAQTQFQSNNSPQILLATDLAAEGLNLQFAAHKVIHFDIPWNPSRLEQRNGRVDRYAQPKKVVHCLHFLAQNSSDHQILKQAILKMKKIREDLGPNNQVIANDIEDKLLNLNNPKLKAKPSAPTPKLSTQQHIREIQKISKLIHTTQNKIPITNDNQRKLINAALKLLKLPPLQHCSAGWTIPKVPHQWRHTNPNLDTKPNSVIFHRHKKLHLNHPLLKHALHLLTNQQPDSTTHQSPTRIALLTTNERSHSIRLFQRVAWFNTLGAKIHEFNLQLDGRLRGPRIEWLQQKQNTLPKAPHPHTEKPNAQAVQFIEQHSKKHAEEIDKALSKFLARERSRANRALRKIRQKRLLHERQTCLLKLEEIQKRRLEINQSRQQLLWPIQLFNKENDSLSLRESQLLQQLDNIPKQLAQQLTLHKEHGLQITPVATLYFCPK